MPNLPDRSPTSQCETMPAANPADVQLYVYPNAEVRFKATHKPDASCDDAEHARFGS
jgi:hypothetical protein